MRRHRHKFHAEPVEQGGRKYASKKEARYAAELELRKQSGEVLFWLEQVPFRLPGGVTYRLDFLEFLSCGEVRCVDVKGHRTEQYILKKKQIEAIYPVEIEEV